MSKASTCRIGLPGTDFRPKNHTTRFFRTVGFHYFLGHVRKSAVTSPSSRDLSFVRNGVGEASAFINVVDSLVDRIPRRRGAGQRLRLALRFRRLLSDWARGPNRWPRSGGGFMWLRTRPSSRVVRIGNSRGIRIPKALRDEASLPEEVELHAEPGRLIVQAVRHPRTGWAAAAKRMRARGDDRLNEPVATKFDRAEWEWR